MKLKYIVITLFFSLLQNIYSKKQIMVLEGDFFNKALKNSIETKSKLFIIFYIDECPYCNQAIKVLKEKIINKYDDIYPINFAIVNLDKEANMWLGVRFNITRIPHVILIENKRMYHFQNQFEESVVLKFIEEKKLKEDSLDIPQHVGIMSKANVIIGDLTEKIKAVMQFLFDKYGIKIFWNHAMTYIFLFFAFIIMIYLENKIIIGIINIYKFIKFRNKKNHSDNDNNENNDKNKENEGKEVLGDKKEKKE